MNQNMNEEKTETPTEYRIKKFRKNGKTKYSQELNSLLILLIGSMSLWWSKDLIILDFIKITSHSYHFNINIAQNQNTFLLETFAFLKDIAFAFVPFFLFLILASVIPPILLSGINLNFKSLSFNFKKLNPCLGLKRIFSIQTIINFFLIMLKLLFISSVSYYFFRVHLKEILFLILEIPISALSHGFKIISISCILVILGLIPIVLFDVIWKQFIQNKQLKMTHQEIKDELKEREGNPNIKIRIRQEMKAIVRRRMILDIPKADVIITNPMHYAVALKYDKEKMNAPKVIAKGAGEIALKIKKIASINQIAIISLPSLARSLYRYSEIGKYIPSPLYQAVAEVLAWVWKVRKWKKEGGVFPERPKNISVPSELNFTGEHKNND
ncbi:flagellar type III secretion system protein FlhB [Buchnera aphidicola (Muscaphis stroyani)]|uniref:Flagellar biosynthetic protein FlhB n=1 Tax=Buchnera aphidicola (Muscaphis stroyani) TaxID=1241869 RepID=A0A4D6YES8_9GAMM|nr:flagellar biosynthesis protein FlhB [Buchnera aphidicola]QCI24324.1 flagellar type III secretion system protein FlhB [Buchnera aphidicola (Muscaphis stroyani)]